MVGTTTETRSETLENVLAAAASAARPLAELPPRDRAALLTSVAEALDANAAALVPLAERESNLPEARLTGELARTTFQLRQFATQLREGSFLDVVIDTADPGHPLGPKPDLRRMVVPLGPVLVFAASNFPFAFSVAGGDTASALAAGCPVVLKAHPGHPELSRRTAEVVTAALADAPRGTFALAEGLETGRAALLDPRIKAGAFTGSVTAGRALSDLAGSRPEPIPFYGELGSLNPAFVTPGAVRARGEEIASGFVSSFTLGAGQFCTKPGLLFLPSGHGLADRLAAAVRGVTAAAMLGERIRDGFTSSLGALADVPGVEPIVSPAVEEDGRVSPGLFGCTVPTLLANRDTLLRECFGPASLVVTYEGNDELFAAADALEGNLTATVHAGPDERDTAGPLLERLRDHAGRLIVDGWPTGVAVSPAMHHGGPYPATTSPLHTSVGATAIRRFLRPVCYQNAPQELLPPPLRDRNELGIPRLVDGRVTTEHLTAKEN
ncbi:NADP-dependent aldehyde dehydrogenase [Prauserella shujinwangii]|uniref:NADP-dependent aldehyde dehydrogenase n=1 Tax=Prauserella shujinwangii TaxID=1453103 RepID=A0A2T0LZ63_9PSEU|nr:aldehyde dehydrogenase (NADP(+)) [Prauserella shujinwangii]PRX49403.1 NADP-dependent aldehyde dehydrogenase [Prauserella shujinwangii]